MAAHDPEFEEQVVLEFGPPAAPDLPRDASHPDAVHLLAFSSVRGIGTAALRAIAEFFPQLEGAWEDDDRLRSVLQAARIKGADRLVAELYESRDQRLGEAERTFAELNGRGVQLIVKRDDAFPPQLRALPDGPQWLFVEGDASILHRTSSVAVVGTREASRPGECLAQLVTERLVEWGYVVVSGLAEGIDTAAHRTAVELGGPTVGVLGTGIEQHFPASTAELRAQMLRAGGAVVTEYFPGVKYSRENFVQRNRIQAGLASAVIPVESRARSGTAHTVRFAETYQRLLIGVWNELFPGKQKSEILRVLEGNDCPIVNLASAEGTERLRSLLSPFEADRQPVSVDPVHVWRTSYGGALKGLRTALRCRPPNPAAEEWLIEAVRKLMRELDRPYGD